ncbi:leucine-rich repeat extensin-like protein 5 [Drosophila eugracilis]|uniref:leucine-rich repeat extensin-like protein 5 n=1 Tax=Drosophila eugracilis TaxID=29029 RepID=UPI001BD9E967|nr:leucine-rich repeat extensin-like protein 5 [Drosophila eugracilis]
MSDQKVCSWLLQPVLLLICLGLFPAEVITNSIPNPCQNGQVYANGACSPVIVNVYNGYCGGQTGIPCNSGNPVVVTGTPGCPNAPVPPTVDPAKPLCPNTPLNPIVDPVKPLCPNTPLNPIVDPSSPQKPAENPSTPTSPNTPLNPIVDPVNPLCPNTPLKPIVVPATPACPNAPLNPIVVPATPPCPNAPLNPIVVPGTPTGCPPSSNCNQTTECPNNCPNSCNTNCPSNCPNPAPCPTSPPIITPVTTPAPETPPAPQPTPSPYPPPTSSPITTLRPEPIPVPTPPPAPIIRCPQGTILVKGACRLLYCGRYEIYNEGRCIKARCPAGYVWTGIRCSKPSPIDVGTIYIENNAYQKSGGLPQTFTNVNNVEVNASIAIQGQTSEEEEEEEEEKVVVAPQLPSGPCCNVVAPRICTSPVDQFAYKCFSRTQQQCGSFCSANKVVLAPPSVTTWTQANNQMLVMPPNWVGQGCQSNGGICQQASNYDCSGCAMGDFSTCSSYCYSYKCSSHNCAYYDQSQYCSQFPGQIGCRADDGWFPSS